MEQIKLFIELTRLTKPIGYMLLFWPCAWGLTAAYNFSGEKITFIIYLFFFLGGAILMRSAGCIVNDIADRKFDKKVNRTKNRPLASGKISLVRASIYSICLCILAFFILIKFNYLTIILALASMPLAFAYPLMKRYTYWPQLFLGITFNYGLILGWTSITNELNILPFLFYFGAIFWTLAYDTIYGLQDIEDDEVIGLKSTSLKFKNNIKVFLFLSYTIFILLLLAVGFILKLNIFFFICVMIASIQMYIIQIYRLRLDDSASQFKIFKSNNFIGLIIFVGLILGKI